MSSVLALVGILGQSAAEQQDARAAEALAGTISDAATSSSTTATAALQEQQQEEAYVSTSQGYSLRIPKSWEQKGKAGADVLWEDPQRRSTSVGVTVNAVRVKSIEDFGTVDVVGTRLLEAEKKKESTISVVMLRQSSRQGAPPSSSSSSTSASSQRPAATLYDFEYELDSTRGRKRILNTVTISDSRLYILNAQYKCDKPKPEDVAAAAVAAGMVVREEPVACIAAPGSLDTLRQVAASFGVLPPSSRR